MVSPQLDLIKQSKVTKSRTLFRLASVVLLASTLLFVAMTIFVWKMPAVSGIEEPVDAVVVLGCRVLPSGEPSVALRDRATRGAKRALEREAVIVFTGGTGTHGESEAKVASRVALELGVPPEKIRLEEASTSTSENAKFVAENFGFKRVEIVTDNYHGFRARRVFKNHFDHVSVQTVQTRFPHVLWSAGREVLAIGFYGLTGRL